MLTSRTVLVVGANGGIGREACLAFQRQGWRVRALARQAPAEQQGIEWRQGDAMHAASVLAAAEGVDVIVHAVNPPGYRNWDTLVLPMLDNTIAAAKAAGARIVLPGTIYNFGPDAFGLLREDSPQHPHTRKGEIRAEMEQRLARASGAGARALVLRCGDFIGPRLGNNWFSQGLVQAGKPVRALRYPADYAHRHAWAYLPDVAQTIVRLVERERELDDFAVYHFGGYWLDGHAMAEAVRHAAKQPDIARRRFPWWLTAVLAPFMETLRELRKMRYLWQESIQLDDAKLVAFLGERPYTPIDVALRTTLMGLGCVDARH